MPELWQGLKWECMFMWLGSTSRIVMLLISKALVPCLFSDKISFPLKPLLSCFHLTSLRRRLENTWKEFDSTHIGKHFKPWVLRCKPVPNFQRPGWDLCRRRNFPAEKSGTGHCQPGCQAWICSARRINLFQTCFLCLLNPLSLVPSP